MNESSNGEQLNEGNRPLTRLVGVVLIGTAVLIAWLLLVGFLGYQSGQQLLVEKQEAEFVAALERQIELARMDVSDDKYDLALVRLDWVLQRDGGNKEALALQAEIDATLASAAEEAEELVETAVSTPIPEEEIEVVDDGSPSDELQKIRRLIATKKWAEALSALRTFQITFPNYERNNSDQLLYDVYVEYGLQLLNGDNVELGLNYLALAGELGTLPQEVEAYRIWGALYSQGIAYYGVNWDLSAYFLRDLCLSAPFFQNSCDTLFAVLVNLGDQYAFALDWCPALLYYEEASFQQTSVNLNEKLDTANEMCLQATVTPSQPISGTITTTIEGESAPIIETPTVSP